MVDTQWAKIQFLTNQIYQLKFERDVFSSETVLTSMADLAVELADAIIPVWIAYTYGRDEE